MSERFAGIILRLGITFFALLVFIFLRLAWEPHRLFEPLPGMVSTRLQQWILDHRHYTLHFKLENEYLGSPREVERFYASRDFQPAWVGEEGLQPWVDEWVQTLLKAEEDGLRPDEYHALSILDLLNEIRREHSIFRPGSVRVEKISALEMLLTDAFFSYAQHLSQGRIQSEPFYAQFGYPVWQPVYPEILEKAIRSSRISACLEELRPRHSQYRRLREALRRYRAIPARIEAIRLKDTLPVLQNGVLDPVRIPELRTKLRAWGDLARTRAVSEIQFDPELEEAVKKFQRRVHLEESGKMDSSTLAAFNCPVERDIHRLELNLERWRWVPRMLGERCVVVNIPAFQLKCLAGEDERLLMRVVVGQDFFRTPVFSNFMRYLVFNPSWEIPPDLLVKDHLEKIRADPGYFARHQINVFLGWQAIPKPLDPMQIDWENVTRREIYERYRFQQAPGPNNPLGQIKFMFPNPFNVYLHDTPKRDLFARNVRNFSSGCIRLENPLGLAEFVMKGNGFWNHDHLQGALESGWEQKVRLPKPMPVHILYLTAWVENDGAVYFYPDVYGWDRKLDYAYR